MAFMNCRRRFVVFGGRGLAAVGFLNDTWEFGADCPADFNGDGLVDPDDLSNFISAFFANPPANISDFDCSGTVDPDDLSDFLTRYFSGC